MLAFRFGNVAIRHQLFGLRFLFDVNLVDENHCIGVFIASMCCTMPFKDADCENISARDSFLMRGGSVKDQCKYFIKSYRLISSLEM